MKKIKSVYRHNVSENSNVFFNLWLYFIVLLFFAPFFGNLGRAIFLPLGKYYYAALFVFCTINFVCRSLFYRDSFNNFLRGWIFTDKWFFVKVLVAAYIFIACIIINRAFVDFVYLIVLLGFFMYFASYKFTSRNLTTLSILASFLNILLMGLSFIKKFDYFNPNTYAEMATVLFLLSCIGYKSTSERQILLIANFAVAIFTAEIIYKAETQLLTLMFFIGLFIMRKYLFKDVKRTRFMILAVWLFVTCLPLVTYQLINMDVLTESVFSNRGERWVLSLDAFKTYGIFASNMDVPGSHNGFLDVCVKYTFIGAVLFVVCMIRLYFIYSPNIVKNDLKVVMLCTILSIVFMNSVESIFVGLTDGYFLIILTGMLISLCVDERQKQNEGEKQLNRGKIYREKCYI